jgi:hypothetical protein
MHGATIKIKNVLFYWGQVCGLIALGFGTERALMHLGLIDRPFVPHVNSWEPCYFQVCG